MLRNAGLTEGEAVYGHGDEDFGLFGVKKLKGFKKGKKKKKKSNKKADEKATDAVDNGTAPKDASIEKKNEETGASKRFADEE